MAPLTHGHNILSGIHGSGLAQRHADGLGTVGLNYIGDQPQESGKDRGMDFER